MNTGNHGDILQALRELTLGAWIVEFIAATGLALMAIPFRSAWVYGLLATAILALGPFIMIFVLSFGFFSQPFRLRHRSAFLWTTRVPPVVALTIWSYQRKPILVISAAVVGALSCYFWAESDKVIRAEMNQPERP